MNSVGVGKYHEQSALKYLESVGMKLIKSNYRFGRNEIDLILSDNGVLVFVEVKYRHYSQDYNLFSTIDRKKIVSISTCAKGFLKEFAEYRNYYSRFDAVLIVKKNSDEEVHHIKNAFSMT